MNTKKLQTKYPQLLEHMRITGYSKNYMQYISHFIGQILEAKWKSYEEILNHYEKTAVSKRDSSKKKAVLNVIASFDCHDVLPGTQSKSKYFHRASAYDYLNQEYKDLVDKYSSNADTNHKKESTVRNECRNAGSFLMSLQKSGFGSLSSITGDAVISVLTDEFGCPSKSSSYSTQIIAVFKKLAEQNNECLRIMKLIPKIRKHRKNVQYLTPDERTRVKNALKDTENIISPRNRAIGHLLYFTGLRCSDISNLKFSDLDLDKDEICIRQQKTNSALKLPLSAIVGNSIYDYVNEYRVQSESPYIFLSESTPYGKLNPASISTIANQIYDNAGIRLKPADRRGGHLFRHNFATTMLENGVSRAVISSAMGHNSPASVETYLSADMVHLKECSLSIEDFPLRNGVFRNE